MARRSNRRRTRRSTRTSRKAPRRRMTRRSQGVMSLVKPRRAPRQRIAGDRL